MLEHEGRLLLERPAPPGPRLGPLAAPLFFFRPARPRRLIAFRSRRTALRIPLVDLLDDVEAHN